MPLNQEVGHSYFSTLTSVLILLLDFDLARKFFLCAVQFSDLLPDTAKTIETKRLSILRAVAVSLTDQSAKEIVDMKLLQEVLVWLDTCEECSRKIAELKKEDVEVVGTSMLHLMKIHALTLLGDAKVVSAVKHAASQKGITEENLARLSELCLLVKNSEANIAVEVLSVCLRIHTERFPVNYMQCCRVLRRLVTLKGKGDEAWDAFTTAESLLKKADKGILLADTLQSEITWMMATSWNNGVYKFRLQRASDAEKWMTLSLKFLTFLSSKSDYESEMMASYNKVLKHCKSYASTVTATPTVAAIPNTKKSSEE
eukprot:TRINITY_DN2172_c0_g1_i1.p1 TRINITY_DN2172_c0_g1~~TRINITY_DN2172_c0_g1_i1.p1  ORF type:complete len:314 (-),score=36.54 TRINITY_DN2172_c0_g1_i1:218-1159(-)